MRDKLYNMDYTQFINYLNSRDIKYIETVDVDIDVWFTEFTIVNPINSKLVARFFDNDGGLQLH